MGGKIKQNVKQAWHENMGFILLCPFWIVRSAFTPKDGITSDHTIGQKIIGNTTGQSVMIKLDVHEVQDGLEIRESLQDACECFPLRRAYCHRFIGEYILG
jgi:hypothetical protein